MESPILGATETSVRRSRPWDRNFLAGLGRAASNDVIRFELVEGRMASGRIRYLEGRRGAVVYLSGELDQPEAGRFFFQTQATSGLAGEFVGVVEFPASGLAYRIEPGDSGDPVLLERPLDEVKCTKLPRVAVALPTGSQEIPPLNPGAFPEVPTPGYQNGIVLLESLPGASVVIYLDFQGGYTATWGGIAYDGPGYGKDQIREIWQRVAEDLLPFNINVTTDLKAFQNAAEGRRQHVIITPTDSADAEAGGVAYEGSFNWSGDTPCWVFQLGEPRFCAQACSHEIGHTLGLHHEGQNVNGLHSEYFYGHGSGETGWAPIMGVGYSDNVTQWARGEYIDASNPEDQLAKIISLNNGVQYRPDDTGDTLATARYLEVYNDFTAAAEGVIETTGDADAFRFSTSGGDVYLRADPVAFGPNLALEALLCDSSGTLLASNNPQATLWADISTNLPAGTYTFTVRGAGRNDPVYVGFSSYASLGYYSITGKVSNARLPDRFVIPENTRLGAVVGHIPAADPGEDPLQYAITSGNLGNTFGIDSFGTLSVANDFLLDYESLAALLNSQFPVQFEMFLTISNLVHPDLTETGRRVVVEVTNVDEPPTLEGFAASVIEHSARGTIVGTAHGSASDAYSLLSYSIVAGNSNGAFSIDSQSGLISVAADLAAATQNLYHLAVVLTDQTPSTVFSATTTVTVTVTLPYPNGSMAYALYTNLPGTAVSNLTTAVSFPHDAALEKQVTLFESDTGGEVNCGAVMRGYLLPPTTGSYTFWIASQNDSELWLSASTNPALMSRVGYVQSDSVWPSPRQWTLLPSQQSAPVSLAAGYAYYIEARLKAGPGPGRVAVAWESASNGITQAVIPGSYLAPYALNYAPHPQGFTGFLRPDALAGSYLGTVRVGDLNSNDVPTLTITSGDDQGLFEIDGSGRIYLSRDLASEPADKTNYVLQVEAMDSGQPPLTGRAVVSFQMVGTNAILTDSIQQEIWTNIGSGTQITDLTFKSKYPKRPDLLRALTAFDSGPESLGTNYGSRIRAYLVPTNSGPYTFYLSSSDSAELLFQDLEATWGGISLLAHVDGQTAYREWTRYPSQQSAPIELIAGQRYYLEAVHKAAGGGDHIEVGWTGPGLEGTNPIPASFLAPFDINYPPDLETPLYPIPLSTPNGGLVAVLTGTDSPLDTFTFRIVSGNQGGTFSLDPISGRLVVADRSLFASHTVSDFNLVIEVQDSGYGGLYPLGSSQTIVPVHIVDDSRPFTWIGRGDTEYWSEATNWDRALPGESAKLTFQGSQRQTNFNDLLLQAGLVTIQNGGFYLSGNPLLLREGLTSQGTNVWAIGSTLIADQTFNSISGLLTVAAPIENGGHELSLVSGSGLLPTTDATLRLEGVISGSGSLNIWGGGTVVLAASNSYTGQTLVGQGRLELQDANSLASSSDISLLLSTLDARPAGGLTIPAQQTLEGGGTVMGPTVVNGNLAPGGGYGTISTLLNFSDSLELANNTVLKLYSFPTAFSDRISVGGTLRFGGSLVVVNTGFSTAPFPAFGNQFKLFSASRFTGSFTNLSLPYLSEGLVWDTSRLMSDGIIRVAATPPQLSTVTLTNGAPAVRFQGWGGLNYRLETTSDLVSPVSWSAVGTFTGSNTPVSYPSNNIIWYVDVPLEIIVPVDLSKPQTFYRVSIYHP